MVLFGQKNLNLQNRDFFEKSGVGIHSGQVFNVLIQGSPSGSGIRFFAKNARLSEISFEAPALWTRLSGTTRSTALVLRGAHRQKVEVRTIEHLLAALFVLGLPDVDIHISPVGVTDDIQIFEIPVLDGSAKPWFLELKKLLSIAGQSNSLLKNKVLWKIVKDKIFSDAGDRYVHFQPPVEQGNLFLPLLEIESSVDFGGDLKQSKKISVNWLDNTESLRFFENEVAGARTFGFKHEVDELLKRGLALGASLENAILLDGNRVVNNEGFRMAQELAAHKLLDALGDFALLGAPFMGRVRCHKAGHALHGFALREAIEQEVLIPGHLGDDGQFVEHT